MRRPFLVLAAAALTAAFAPAAAGTATPGAAAGPFVFRSLTGETLALDDWRGRPVLVVNTASMCGFTGQLEDMQALYDRFRDRGLVVLAVPSGDFNQEFRSDAEVAAFCEVNFALDFPMASLTRLRGPGAHPFYAWLAAEHGIRPRWNFHKVLLGRDGQVLGSWGSMVRPTARPIVAAVEAALAG
jgi:glutathione peroxidase